MDRETKWVTGFGGLAVLVGFIVIVGGLLWLAVGIGKTAAFEG